MSRNLFIQTPKATVEGKLEFTLCSFACPVQSLFGLLHECSIQEPFTCHPINHSLGTESSTRHFLIKEE